MKNRGQKTFEPKQTIIKYGETSQTAYLITEGIAEISYKNSKRESTVVAEIHPGEIIGELRLIQDKPATETVRAKTKVVVNILDTKSLEKLLCNETGKQLRPLLQTLCERLRIAESRLAELAPASNNNEEELAPDSKIINPEITIKALTPAAQEMLEDTKTITVRRFPFNVGRYDTDMEKTVLHFNHLYLRDREPFSISRSHFAFTSNHNDFFVIDRGSKLGCQVNGKLIGGDNRKSTKAKLKQGMNEIIIGGNKQGDLKFQIILQAQQEAEQQTKKGLFSFLKKS